MNIVIPMAGEGRRFQKGDKQTVIKPLIDVFGKPMAVRAIETLGIEGRLIFVVQDNEIGYKIIYGISEYYKNYSVYFVHGLTDGPAVSALAAEAAIDNDEDLIITNCDQIMTWDPHAFSVFQKNIDYDGIIVTYFCDTNKNSYARVGKDGLVTEIREKEIISNISLNGIHCWKHGSDFVSSAKEMIEKNDRAINGEFYIGPTYNYLINHGKRVGIYHVPNSYHHAVGIPEDLERYIRENS